MKHFQLTASSFEGAVDLYFNDLNLLERFDTSRADLSEKQQIWILQSLPRELAEVKSVMKKSPNVKITEVSEEVTFDMFWNKYDDKLCSSKKKAILKWNKMPLSERQKAYNSISKYFQYLAPGTRKKYAETYLNAELWNN